MARPAHVRVPLLLFLLVLLAPALHADDPTTCGRALWSVPWVTYIPQAGTLAAGGVWPEASAFTGLCSLSGGQLSRSQPVFWVARDAEKMIVAWRVPRLGDRPLAKLATEDDGPLWNDDSVEIFLDPGHTHRDYLQFMVNAAGTRADARGRDLTWDGEWQVHIAEEPQGWAGVALIPFRTLQATPPGEGTIWAANFAVDRSPQQRPVSAWEPEEQNLTWARLGSGSTFHEPVSFGHLIFRAVERVQIISLGEPWRRQLHVQGASTAPVRVELTGLTEPRTWVLAPAAQGAAIDLAPTELPPGDCTLSIACTSGDRTLAFVQGQLRVADRVDARLETLALAQTVAVQARLEVPDPPTSSELTARLLDRAGQAVREGVLRLSEGVTNEALVWPFADLPVGDYRLVLQDAQEPDLRVEVPWAVPARPSWLGSTAGRFGDEHVLSPWTSLQVRSRQPLRIACWGREYGIAEGGLLAEVQSLEQPLLARPMALHATVRGEPVRLRPAPAQVTREAPGAVEFTSTQTAQELSVSCEGRLEFDGFVKLRLLVTGQAGGPVLESLTFDIPLAPEVARLMHHFPRPSVWVKVDPQRLNARAVPPEDWASPFLFHVWVGNEERGLQWLCETDEPWRPADPARAIELIHEPESVILRLNLIGRPTRLERPLEYVFAFQASPVKPKPRDYRHWRYAQVASYGIEKSPFVPGGPARTVTYPAEGNIRPERGTVEVTVTPRFDSTAPGELNRSLFTLHWPADTRMEPERGLWFYWNQDDRGMRVVFRDRNEYQCVCGSRFAWQPGDTHTVAFTWGEQPGIYVDRQWVGGLPPGQLLSDPVPLAEAVLRLGGTDCDFVVHQIRISDICRSPDTLGAGSEPLAADDHTLLLDRFEDIAGSGAERVSRPVRIAGQGVGQISSAVAVVRGGLDLSRPPFRGTYLDYVKQLGLQFLGFHEHWSDWQGFPRTSHTDELRSLIAACHEKGLKLILYHSWQLADIAPEYPLYLRECEVIHPERFIYTRQPSQRDYPVCARSAWADFMADGIQTLLRDYGPDGIYSDGLSYPGECGNPLHGCGYVGEDGQRHPTFSLFPVREAMKRFRYLLEQQGKPTLFVCHTSGAITLPTLAFADAYLDGEHLCNLPRPLRVPLDSFRAEFMGHNFGLPAYFLVYDWAAGMTTPEALALCLLHDTELPWSYEAMAPVWRAWDEFGVDDSQFQGYWANEGWLAAAPEGVQVSSYLRPDGQRLLVVVNTTEAPAEGEVRLRGPVLRAREVLTGAPMTVTEGAIQGRFEPWRINLIQVTTAAQ